MPFQGGFLFGARCPMALPWATSEVPLTGRQILRRSAQVFCTMQDDPSKGCPSQIIQKNDRGGMRPTRARPPRYSINVARGVAAVWISGPSDRVTPKTMPQFAAAVKSQAFALSRRLGYPQTAASE